MKKDLVTIKEEYFIKFKKLYKEEFEEEYNQMTEEQLFNSATALINLVDAVYRPILKGEYKEPSQSEK